MLQTQCGCPILYGYRTSSASNELWLSDSLRLSDKQCFKRSVVVRFFTVIGQAVLQTQCGCPILYGYRTSSASNELWLSDSLRLSDKQCFKRIVVVRFFTVIGQAVTQTHCGCPILYGYRTSGASNALRLSDSLRLSDKQCPKRIAVVRFFTVIGQAVLQTQCGCPILYGYRTSSASNAVWLSDSFWRITFLLIY